MKKKGIDIKRLGKKIEAFFIAVTYAESGEFETACCALESA